MIANRSEECLWLPAELDLYDVRPISSVGGGLVLAHVNFARLEFIVQFFFAFAQRAAAALRAISLLRLLLSFSALARPPTVPPFEANSERSSGDILFIRIFPPTLPPSLPRATAAGFFLEVTVESYHFMLDNSANVWHLKYT